VATIADVTQLAVALVPSCPETGLGTGRSPSGGPAWTAPAVPAADRRGAGPARPEPRARHPDPHVSHRYPALTGRRPPAASTSPGSRPRRPARWHDHGTRLALTAPDHPVVGFWSSSQGSCHLGIQAVPRSDGAGAGAGLPGTHRSVGCEGIRDLTGCSGYPQIPCG